MRYLFIFAGIGLIQPSQGKTQSLDHSHHSLGKLDAVTAVTSAMNDVASPIVSSEISQLKSTVVVSAVEDHFDGTKRDRVEAVEDTGERRRHRCVVSSDSIVSSASLPSPASTRAIHTYSSIASMQSAPAHTSPSFPLSSSGISRGNLSPHGKKAGLSGYIGIQNKPSFSSLTPYISWYSDYSPRTPDVENIMGIGMLWGAAGSPCAATGERLRTYRQMVQESTPQIMFGFYEPDCPCELSSNMSVADAAAQWDSLIAPLAAKGAILGSPSMCKQTDENFLTPFSNAISQSWDVTSIHINKPDLAGAKKDIEYYVKTYGKKIWVSEFACVNDHPNWSPCTDRTQITSFINDLIPYFENNDDVVAYGPSNGEGLGDVWPLTDPTTGELTDTGITYLNAIKKF